MVNDEKIPLSNIIENPGQPKEHKVEGLRLKLEYISAERGSFQSDAGGDTSRKSKNNRRKTQGRFTDNPKQYMQFLNWNKYMQRKDEDHITIINKNTQDVKANFDYVELCKYLDVNNLDLGIPNM
nr:81_t:CDS:2 [Entrophospora candida]